MLKSSTMWNLTFPTALVAPCHGCRAYWSQNGESGKERIRPAVTSDTMAQAKLWCSAFVTFCYCTIRPEEQLLFFFSRRFLKFHVEPSGVVDGSRRPLDMAAPSLRSDCRFVLYFVGRFACFWHITWCYIEKTWSYLSFYDILYLYIFIYPLISYYPINLYV